MVIIGTKGHAKELLEIIKQDHPSLSLFFFDDITLDASDHFYGFEVLKTLSAVKTVFEKDKSFALGMGGVQSRHEVFKRFIAIDGNPVSLISSRSYISSDVVMGVGLNVMPYSSINNNVIIGDAVLLNAYASIHHDSIIGDFVEISPGARILGGCTIGSFTCIGANATLLPNIQLGTNVIIAAGAVVTKNVPDNTMVAGNPAVIKKQLLPLN